MQRVGLLRHQKMTLESVHHYNTTVFLCSYPCIHLFCHKESILDINSFFLLFKISAPSSHSLGSWLKINMYFLISMRMMTLFSSELYPLVLKSCLVSYSQRHWFLTVANRNNVAANRSILVITINPHYIPPWLIDDILHMQFLFLFRNISIGTNMGKMGTSRGCYIICTN